MNREDIIRMAIEAGLNLYVNDLTEKQYIEVVEHFAALVASAEREACAALCFDIWNRWLDSPEEDRHKMLYDAEDCADAIRARGNVATNDTSQERVDKTSESVHEPVAWISATELLVMRGNALGGAKDWRVNLGLEPEEGDVGLYTTPPQRKPLTDEEIYDMYNEPRSDAEMIAFARAIEAAHGIKGEA